MNPPGNRPPLPPPQMPLPRRPAPQQQLRVEPRGNVPPHFAAKPDEPAWFGNLKIGSALLIAIAGLISDVLQPIVAAASYFLAGSIGAAILLFVVRRRLSADPFLRANILVPSAIATAFTIVVAGVVVIGQNLLPGAQAQGVVGTASPAVRDLQEHLVAIRNQLTGLGRSVERVERGVARVEKGVTRVETGVNRLQFGVGAIDRTTRATDERTKVIARHVEDITRGSDPEANARRRIKLAGYTADDAGLTKAILQASDTVEQFKELGIRGNEALLQQAILSQPLDSKEFENSLFFMIQAPTEGLGGPAREDIKRLLGDIQRTKSVGPLRQAVCGTSQPPRFAERLARVALKGECASDKAWKDRSIAFAKRFLIMLPMETQMWWHLKAPVEVAYRPASIHAIPLAHFIAIAQGRKPHLSETIRVEARVSFMEGGAGTTIDIFDPATGFPAAILMTTSDAALKRMPCWVQLPNTYNLHEQNRHRRPRCTARLVVDDSPTRGLQLVAVENVHPIGGAGPSRR